VSDFAAPRRPADDPTGEYPVALPGGTHGDGFPGDGSYGDVHFGDIQRNDAQHGNASHGNGLHGNGLHGNGQHRDAQPGDGQLGDAAIDEPDAAMIAAMVADPLTPAAELAEAVAWCYDEAALALLLSLIDHDDARVRRAVAQALPSVLGETESGPTVQGLIRLSRDGDDDVRDWACFALGTQLSEIDDPALRDALIARLEDPHDDTRCEALLGLARRRDVRTLPVLKERLAKENVYSLEIDAAGALGDPSLHWMVRSHLAGWDDDVVARVCAALRLTDPSGVGSDLLDGLADWFRLGAPHASDEDRYWWSVTLQVLEHAEYRAPEIAEEVRFRLAAEQEAMRLMLGSRLSQLAGDHGWPHWAD
jgi:HEAT repeat protein